MDAASSGDQKKESSPLVAITSVGASPGGQTAVIPAIVHCLPPEQLRIYNQGGRIGVYNAEERSYILERFHAKRASRVWMKKVRYGCRKSIADRRVRTQGRFECGDAGASEVPEMSRRDASTAGTLDAMQSVGSYGVQQNSGNMAVIRSGGRARSASRVMDEEPVSCSPTRFLLNTGAVRSVSSSPVAALLAASGSGAKKQQRERSAGNASAAGIAERAPAAPAAVSSRGRKLSVSSIYRNGEYE
jgi:hypothetical protein